MNKHFADERAEIRGILLEEMGNHLTMEELVLFEKTELERITDRVLEAVKE